MHRGCLALAERPADVALDAVLATNELVVVLERVVDPDNVGSVFRNAEAFGADAVLLSPGCCDPLYRKALRTSSGAALMVPFYVGRAMARRAGAAAGGGLYVAAMTPDGGATDIGVFWSARARCPRGGTALLLGTEGHGLTDEAIAPRRGSLAHSYQPRSGLFEHCHGHRLLPSTVSMKRAQDDEKESGR